jgi:hypothetical protein
LFYILKIEEGEEDLFFNKIEKFSINFIFHLIFFYKNKNMSGSEAKSAKPEQEKGKGKSTALPKHEKEDFENVRENAIIVRKKYYDLKVKQIELQAELHQTAEDLKNLEKLFPSLKKEDDKLSKISKYSIGRGELQSWTKSKEEPKDRKRKREEIETEVKEYKRMKEEKELFY